MPRTPDAEKRRVFLAFHDPNRPIYQIAHARKANKSEDYSSERARAASARIVDKQMEVNQEVFAMFAGRSSKKKKS